MLVERNWPALFDFLRFVCFSYSFYVLGHGSLFDWGLLEPKIKNISLIRTAVNITADQNQESSQVKAVKFILPPMRDGDHLHPLLDT